jgi:hypothetical protein
LRALVSYLGHRNAVKELTPKTIIDDIQDMLGVNVNLAMGLQGVNKRLEKAAGQLLSPFEFDAGIQVIGYGGSTLIGEAYNTLIPLLDRLMMQQAVTSVIDMSYGGLDDQRSLQEEFRKGGLEEWLTKEYRQKVKSNFHSTVAFLGNFQQIVRDAIKAKDSKDGKGGFLWLVNEEYNIKGQTLGEYLSSIPDDDITGAQDSMEKVKTITNFLMTKMGPNIRADGFYTAPDFDYQFTGFGALMLLADFSKTEDKDLYKKFILPDEVGGEQKFNLEAAYKAWHGNRLKSSSDLDESNVSPNLVKRFLSETILDMLQRAQSNFLASVQPGDGQQLDLLKRAAEYTLSKPKLVPEKDKAYTEAVTKYLQDIGINYTHSDNNQIVVTSKDAEYTLKRGEFNPYTGEHLIENYDTAKSFDIFLENKMRASDHNTLLITEVIYQFIKERNKQGGFDATTIEYLKTMAEARGQFIGSKGENTPEQKIEMGNVMVFNQMIRNIQRGKETTPDSALYLASYKLHTMADIIKEFAMEDVYDSKQKQKVVVVRSLVESLSASQEEKNQLTAILMKDNVFEILAGNTAALTKLVEHTNEVQFLKGQREDIDYNQRRADLSNYLATVIQHGRDGMPNLDYIRQLEYGERYTKQNADILETQLAQRVGIDNIDLNKPQDVKSVYRHTANIEIAGALAVPLIFALAEKGLQFNERLALGTLDFTQSLVEVMDMPTTFTHKYMSKEEMLTKQQESLSSAFRQARIRQAIKSEGIMTGTLQGISQELLFRSLSN